MSAAFPSASSGEDQHLVFAAWAIGFETISTGELHGVEIDMFITIRSSIEEVKRLAERAARSGRDMAGYMHWFIERDIRAAALDQALAPFRRQVEESGMPDHEIGDFFERYGKRSGRIS